MTRSYLTCYNCVNTSILFKINWLNKILTLMFNYYKNLDMTIIKLIYHINFQKKYRREDNKII